MCSLSMHILNRSMRAGLVRIASFALVFIVAASLLDAAPVPQFKGLPEEIQVLLKHCTHDCRDLIGRLNRHIQQARTDAERNGYIRKLEELEREFYCMPVKVLENSLGDARYPRHEDQESIRAALTRYRQRFEDAKKKKLFKPETLPTPKKAPR